ncbi:sensor histidine kinase [Cohnella sp. GCM10027633]|uniref:cache domain-containing sensor histidine kinase n=1 Tax=unclassified Cohnella TaxID=2636738 RepID=UPI003641D631
MRHALYKRSFGTRIWLSFLLLISISILATGWASYRIAADTLKKNALQMSQESVNKSAQILDEKLQKIAVSMMSLMMSDSFHDAMDDANARDASQYYLHLSNLQPVFSQLLFNEPIIRSLLLSTRIGDFYPTNNVRVPGYSFYDTPIYKEMKQNRRAIWLEAHQDPFFTGKDRVLSLVMEGVMNYPLNDVYIMVNIKEKDLVSLLESNLSRDSGPIFMLNSSGQPVMNASVPGGIHYADVQDALARTDPSGKSESGAFEYDVDGATYLVNYYRSQLVPDWVVYRMQSEGALLSQATAIKWAAITIVSVFGVVALVFSNVLARLLTRPLAKLAKLMTRVETEDDLGTRYRSHSDDEVGMAGVAFNRMLDRIEKLIGDMREAEQSKRKAEMKALTAHIDPHFFYNALHTVYCKSVLGENEQVNRMIIALSDMFRLGLNNGEDMTTLEAELEHVRQYLTIQQGCYEELFEYEIEAAPNVPLQHPVLKLVLQPLVENSILHGFRERTEGGFIRVEATADERFLYLIVADNGDGFDPAAKAQESSEQEPKRSGGYALRNIAERLALYEDKQAGLLVESTPGRGTTVTVTIPREGGVWA